MTQCAADIRVSYLVHVRTYCVPIANLNQNKRTRLLCLGHTKIIIFIFLNAAIFLSAGAENPIYLHFKPLLLWLSIKLGRGQGDAGTFGREGRGDVWDGDAGDVNDYCKSRR